MKTTEELLDSLRDDTSMILSMMLTLGTGDEFIKGICNDFLLLDMKLTEGEALPGAWGKSKLSKSNQPGPSQDGVYHITDT